jgi:hypothetical protein
MTLEDFYQLPLRPTTRKKVMKVAREYKRRVGGPLSMCVREAERLPIFKLADRLDPKTQKYVSPLSLAGLGEVLSK